MSWLPICVFSLFSFVVVPTIKESDGNNTIGAELGGMVNFTCSADGLPGPSVMWIRDGALLVEVPSRVQVSVATQPAFRPFVSDVEVLVSTVTLQGIEKSDNNTELYCVVENGFGEPAVLYPPYRLTIASIPGLGKLHSPQPLSIRFDCLCFSFSHLCTDSCANNPCQNGGSCHALSATTYECVCTNGFTGNNCEQGRQPWNKKETRMERKWITCNVENILTITCTFKYALISVCAHGYQKEILKTI